MIDWFSLFANSLWIWGCALALATLSHASWQASLNKIKTTTQLAHPRHQRAMYFSAILFCSGLALLASSTVQILVWSILGVLFLVALAASFWKPASHSSNKKEE